MTGDPVSTTGTSIHAETSMGLVSLAVGDLARSLAFYRDAFGLTLLNQTPGRAVLGAGGAPLLALNEEPGAVPAPERAAGLYHFAILLPSRADLAAWLLHFASSGGRLSGAADHLVSEALYLDDPEGNGIEVYRDRPRGEWPHANGEIRMATDPLDLQALLDEAQEADRGWTGLPEDTRMGHVHLQVADLAAARRFYHDVLGFDVMVDWSHMGALFVSAGGYHHHLGLNTWHSRGAGPAPAGSAGLRYFVVRLPDAASLAQVVARLNGAGIAPTESGGGAEVRDPSGNRLLLVTGPGAPEAAV